MINKTTIIIFFILGSFNLHASGQDIYGELAKKHEIYETNKSLLFDTPVKKRIALNRIGQINTTCNISRDEIKHGLAGPGGIIAGVVIGLPLDIIFAPFGDFGYFSSVFFRDYNSSRMVDVTLDVGSNKIILRDLESGKDLYDLGRLKKNTRKYYQKFVEKVCSPRELRRLLNNSYMTNVNSYLSSGNNEYKSMLYYEHVTKTDRTGLLESDITLFNDIITTYNEINNADDSIDLSFLDFMEEFNYESFEIIPSKFKEYLSKEPEQVSFNDFKYFFNGKLAPESSFFKDLTDVDLLYDLKDGSKIISYNRELYRTAEGRVKAMFFKASHTSISQSEIEVFLSAYERNKIDDYVDRLIQKYESDWRQESWENPNFAYNKLLTDCILSGASPGICVNYAESNQSRILINYPTKYLIPENKWYEISYDWKKDDIYLTNRGYLRDQLIYDFSDKSLKVSSRENSSITLESDWTTGLDRLEALMMQQLPGGSLNSRSAYDLENGAVVILSKEKYLW